ncbi:winged helix-turn-helix transcriptional regulator [Arthrobacter sp. CAU 1506]|uniref:IclR family transcriptional regulator n=1 Tax=Arthrobacter sp. CAU 1506 TaxID=2560052 RepID=UPI0010AC4680|nr:helix-turn-helix domain-containing protein [Arthrobacter sp. CAU 1506]TJY64096.1 winged helix-turn-helix transcriptional regulator [Arthrobacter sp. CAU 1506]
MTALVQSVGKAVEILKAFDSRHRVLTIRQLSARTGIPRSTCHALCNTLAEEGLLELGSGDGFQLGAMLAKLGGQVIERTGLVDAALGPASSILASTRSEVHVAQYVSTGVVYLLRLQNGRRVPNLNRTGRHWQLHTSACGLAVYAALPPEARAHHASGVDEESTRILTESADTYTKRGYVVFEGSQTNFISVGAPILDRNGDVTGSVGTGDIRQYMNTRRTHEVGMLVRRTAEASSKGLGFFPSYPQHR